MNVRKGLPIFWLFLLSRRFSLFPGSLAKILGEILVVFISRFPLFLKNRRFPYVVNVAYVEIFFDFIYKRLGRAGDLHLFRKRFVDLI